MFSPEELKKIDKSDMYSVILSFPEQIRDAVAIAESVSLPALTPKHIVICAMGGSAISGNLLENYLSGKIDIPIHVVRDYTLPKWVSAEDLVICNSYSGNTEETLSCFDEAMKRKIPVISVTSGGELEARTKKAGMTLIKIPSGFQPRASLAYLLMPLLVTVKRLGLYDSDKDIENLLREIDKLKKELAVESSDGKNVAKKVALDMNGKTPVVYGSGLVASVARRFKAQLNENPQILAFYDMIPESNHNDFNSWPSDAKAKDCVAVLLRYKGEHARNSKRFEIMKKLVLEKNAGMIVEMEARGNNDLSKLLTLVHITDMASYYLAILMGRDPTPVVYIEQLKKELKK